MKTEAELHEMTVAELKDYANDQDIQIKGNASKEILIERIIDGQKEQDLDDLVSPEQDPEIQMSDAIPEQIVLTNATILTRGEVVKAAFRDSDLTIGQWNKLDKDKRDKKVKAFYKELSIPVEQKESIDVEAPKLNKNNIEHIEKILKRFVDRGLTVEADDISWTAKFNGRSISGTLYMSDDTIVRQIGIIMNSIEYQRANVIDD